tara:strand:- start:688 stop:1221 length:534 start_codon:yes stop_codon:yes gene_type:complete
MGGINYNFLPFDFVMNVTDLEWCELLWAYKNKMITSDFLDKYVIDRIYRVDQLQGLLLDMSYAIDEESKLIILCKLAKEGVSKSIPLIQRKWLFLILYWLHDNMLDKDDIFDIVWFVFSDFNYPKSMNGFAKYMPAEDIDTENLEVELPVNTNFSKYELVMIKKWKSFLEDEKKILK